MTDCQGYWTGPEVRQDGPERVDALRCSGCGDVWLIIRTPGRRDRSGMGPDYEAAMRDALSVPPPGRS